MRYLLYLFIILSNITSCISISDIPVYIALKQYNINFLQDRLTDISNPLSNNYGNWMNINEINDIISPPKEHTNTVLNWIDRYNITNVQNYGDSIKFIASPLIIMSMFNISNTISNNMCFLSNNMYNLKNYKIPHYLQHVIEFVEMYSHKTHKNTKINYSNPNTQTDDRYFGREPLINLYNVPTYNLQHNVSVGLVEYQSNNGFTNSDINTQQILNDQAINNITNIVGNNVGIDTETELDVQLVSQAADGVNSWLWQTPYWLYSFAIDFYNKEEVPDTISMSWGWAQDSQCDIIDCGHITSQQYVERVNNEYLKIALRGKTIVVSSGDAGAPGRTNEECDSSRAINPTFPASSPYVVSVGATYVDNDSSTCNYTSPLCLNDGCITSTNEKSIQFSSVGWTAGGGFDKYQTKTPWWQSIAVKSYINSGVILPNQTNYNKNGRVYPDVSAIGHSCPTVIDNQLMGVDGTSCSSPIMAGLLSIINNYMWIHHKIKIGFVNPLLYYIHQHCPDCFQDVKEGYNWCTEEMCCDDPTNYGFNATIGYDPVSGLGTLNVNNILQFIENVLQKGS